MASEIVDKIPPDYTASGANF